MPRIRLCDDYDDGVVARDVARQRLPTPHQELDYVRGRIATLKGERWPGMHHPGCPIRSNELERHKRIDAYRRYLKAEFQVAR